MDGPHVLTVNATVSINKTFWFDYIKYTPSASVPLNQAAILVRYPDPQFQFGAGWSVGMSLSETNVTGSTFTFDFIGMQTNHCSLT